jgi:uncharacterized membrane protein YdjX (TVP38/TMEM64 family)
MTVLCAAGAPRLWLCGIAALVLPPVAAFAVSFLGALAGNYAVFAVCRTRSARRVVGWILRGRQPPVGRLARLSAGVSGVVLLRQAPGPGAVTTILLSRAGVSTRDFLIGSLVGFLPSTLLTVLLAGTAATVLPEGVLAWTSAAVALVAAIVWLVQGRGETRFRSGTRLW